MVGWFGYFGAAMMMMVVMMMDSTSGGDSVGVIFSRDKRGEICKTYWI